VLAGSVAKARKSETRKRAMNACNFKVEVKIIIAKILMMTRIEIDRMLITGNNSNIYKDSFLR
jgi:hypothetical protein